MGTKQARQKQEELFYASERTETTGHPFYEELNRVLSVNTIGVFLTCQAFGRQMLAHGGGAIVVISSVAGFGGQSARLPYVTSKFAVNGIVKTLAVEWARHNVRVNAVAPTFVDTPMIHAHGARRPAQ